MARKNEIKIDPYRAKSDERKRGMERDNNVIGRGGP